MYTFIIIADDVEIGFGDAGTFEDARQSAIDSICGLSMYYNEDLKFITTRRFDGLTITGPMFL